MNYLSYPTIRGIKELKQYLSIKQSHIRAKIIGTTFILIGIGFFLDYFSNPTPINIKIGFTSILLGTIVIFLITDRSVPKNTSDAKIEGNIDVVKKIIRELHLDGNAVFLPKSDILTEERILIPPNKTGIIKVPNIDDDDVFLTGTDGRRLGISIPPSGLKLLKEIEKDEDFENTDMENIGEKLQKFVGMDLLKSVLFKKEQNGWKLELEKPIFCPNDQKLCRQYPCPTCSAVLTAIARASNVSNQKLWINNTTYNGRKITFHINLISKRTKQVG